MFRLNRKILVSGCGISWTGQPRRTWAHVLRTTGLDIVDVGGPAVSNQWIINQAVAAAASGQYTHIILQLTNTGKLDVEVNDERRQELVNTDSVRNFCIEDKVWPSSMSQEHESKKLYYKWLHSPGLETQDIATKLYLLHEYCNNNAIKLIPFQGYSINWTDSDKKLIHHLIYIDDNCWDDYEASEYWKRHDHSQGNTVPCLAYQIKLAKNLATLHFPDIVSKIEVIERLHQIN